MNHLKTGQFHGQTNSTIRLDGLTLTDTEYTHEKVDWHYHENAYFTFILEGNVLEGNRKEVYNCAAGALLFHNWQDPHYNIKPAGYTRGFHIELEQPWLQKFDIDLIDLSGSMNIQIPDLKLLLYKIFKEAKVNDNTSSLALQSQVLQLLTQMKGADYTLSKQKPQWVSKLNGILNETFSENHSLIELANELAIHPVHLSRDFPKYFQCSLGYYIRKLKVQKALSLLSKKNYSLSKITFDCGFADQSHFIRCFKELIGITPLAYKKIITR